nr:aminoacyl-tRNA hydrolase [Chloroflexota bacterium]
MRIVVGLGNPGPEYAGTRHNVGYMVIDSISGLSDSSAWRKRFRSVVTETVCESHKLILVKPQTYMNLSGIAVRDVLNWYHVPRTSLIVIHDDLDLEFGTLRMRARGSAGGHNGMKSLIAELGDTEIPRLKVGVGRSRE